MKAWFSQLLMSSVTSFKMIAGVRILKIVESLGHRFPELFASTVLRDDLQCHDCSVYGFFSGGGAGI